MKSSLAKQIPGGLAGVLLLVSASSGFSGSTPRSQHNDATLKIGQPNPLQESGQTPRSAVAIQQGQQVNLKRQPPERQISEPPPPVGHWWFVVTLGGGSLLALLLVLRRVLSSEPSRMVQPPAPIAAFAEPPLPDAALETRSPLRILLAEDQPLNQKLALLTLAQLGYRADVAGNGLEALAALRRQPYDVVLMDVQMPELDGLETTRQICQQWSAQARPRIIALTANRMPGDRERCLDAGMDDYLSKPVNIQALTQALSRCRRLESRLAPKNPVSSADSVLDRPTLMALQAFLGEDTSVQELIDYYLAQTPRLLATMNTAIAQNNITALRLAAHALQSNSTKLGAVSVASRCAQLEAIAHPNTITQASAVLAQLEADYEQVRTALRLEQPQPEI